jgi:hypothetical protein
MRNLTRNATVAVMIFAGSVSAQDIADPGILDAITALEGRRDPKCFATASRLENFMYGTPLAAEARERKIERQRDLVARAWDSAATTTSSSVAESAIRASLAALVDVRPLPDGAWSVIPGDTAFPPITIDATDLRQYGSVAYSLRTLLSVQQDALLGLSGARPPLEPAALDTFVQRLDIVSLASLYLADQEARLTDSATVNAAMIDRAWDVLLPSADASAPSADPPAPATVASAPTPVAVPDVPVLLPDLIARKISAYEAYNQVSNVLFLRNLQVYFARQPWPSDADEGAGIRSAFQDVLIQFTIDLITAADARAARQGQPVITLPVLRAELDRFMPHELNEYEDVIYYPHLPPGERIVIEAYDLDAFRDGGLHWRVIQWALETGSLDRLREPDPFAAELVAEGVAQLGVLVLRIAGRLSQEDEAQFLRTADIAAATVEIQRLLQADAEAAASPRRSHGDLAVSSPTTVDFETAFFSDVTGTVGVDADHRTADWLSRRIRSYTPKEGNVANVVIPPAFSGSGIAAADLDGDGDDDLVVLSGAGNRLYENRGGAFEDVTEASGIVWVRASDNKPGEPRQPIVADFDNDGHRDLFITYVDDDHRMYRNLGDGLRFEDVTDRADLGGRGAVAGPATALDFDRDGLLDLYVGYFGDFVRGALPTLARHNANGTPNHLFHNLGGFRFENVTAGSGVDDSGWTQAVGHADFDGDGWQDLISGNDFGVNHYYRNNRDGTFTDVSERIGTSKPSYTMNIGIADLNRDRTPDFYISNIVTMDKDQKYVLPSERTRMRFDPDSMANMRVVEANDLFVSVPGDGDLPRYEQSQAIGRGRSSTGWAWDADFFDFDNDGDDDLYCVNGMNEFALYSSEHPYYTDPEGNQREVVMPVSDRESNVFFVNEGGRLNNASKASGADLLGNSRSVAYFDLEGDGDLDMAVNNYHGPVVIYRNNADSLEHNWLKVRLTGDPDQGVTRDAIGTVILVDSATHTNQWRMVASTTGYLSVHPATQHFGLGKDDEAMVTVVWPTGTTTRVGPVAANQVIEIEMPEPLVLEE